jgi:hypothetical protein
MSSAIWGAAMNEARILAQKMYDLLYGTLRAGAEDCAKNISAIDSGDKDQIRECGIDTYYLRHPVDFALERKYWSGQLYVLKLLLETGLPHTALEFGLRPIPSESPPALRRDLKLVVNNTKPRANGAQEQSDN